MKPQDIRKEAVCQHVGQAFTCGDRATSQTVVGKLPLCPYHAGVWRAAGHRTEHIGSVPTAKRGKKA